MFSFSQKAINHVSCKKLNGPTYLCTSSFFNF